MEVFDKAYYVAMYNRGECPSVYSEEQSRITSEAYKEFELTATEEQKQKVKDHKESILKRASGE